MKKILVTGLLSIGIFFQLSAQTKFSVQGGVNLMKLKTTISGLSLTFNSEASLNAGLIADFEGSGTFNLRSGLLYNSYASSVSMGGEKNTQYVNYLSIPLLGRLKLSDKLYGFAGPQLSYLMSAKSKFQNGDSEDTKNELESINFSGLFGAEYQFSEKLRLGMSYTAGLSRVNKETEMAEGLDLGSGKVRFNGFNFNIGFSF
jgi:hypothetical protein